MIGRRKLKKMTQADVNQTFAAQQHGLQINFKNCDLTGLDLSGRIFESVNFENCNLSGANLSGISIKQGSFKNGVLVGVNFEKADLAGVDFTGCAMQNVNLSQVRIEGVGIKESNLASANLKSVNIEFSDGNIFKNVNLSSADLSSSQISWFYGENINFKNANFNDTSMQESQIKDCNFANATLENANLYSVVFKDCEMQESVLAKAQITNVTFETSTLANADFKKSEIEYGNFVDSNLDGADFKEVTLHSTNEFRNVSLVAADFSDAKFSEESKVHNVDIAMIKGLEVSQDGNMITKKDHIAEDIEKNKEELAAKEYQYRLNLFTATYLGSRVNTDVDSKIAQEMLTQGYSPQSIIAAIILHSPNVPKAREKGQLYGINVVKKAQKENSSRS